jgi:hypothetical protein
MMHGPTNIEWEKLSAASYGHFTAGEMSIKIPSGRNGGEKKIRSTLSRNRTTILGRPKPQAIHYSNCAICALTSPLCAGGGEGEECYTITSGGCVVESMGEMVQFNLCLCL